MPSPYATALLVCAGACAVVWLFCALTLGKERADG